MMMTLFKLTIQELRKRWVNFLLGVLSVSVATAVLSGAILLLNAYDQRTDQILTAKQVELEKQVERLRRETVRAMEHLGLNIIILPAGQNLGDWYAEDYAEQAMPQERFEELAADNLQTIDQLVPLLRRKIRWPETQWTVLISGSGSDKAPPRGQVDIGDEIARGLNLKPSDEITLMGRSFKVRNRLKQEAGVEDITLTFSLADAQTLLNAPGKINEIHAGQRRAAWQDVERIRAEVQRILPGAQIVEKGSDVLAKVTAIRQVEEKGAEQIAGEQAARTQMRQSLQRGLAILLPFILLACFAWIYLLAADNATRRIIEIGTLRSIGFPSGSVVFLFILRSLLIGLVGGIAGLLICAGVSQRMPVRLFIILLPLALLMALVGSLIPVRQAINRDPADILRGDL